MTENEFEKMYDSEEFSDDLEEFDNNNISQEEMVASGQGALEYDITKAPSTTKGPEREDLDGKEVIITDVKILLPKPESPWKESRQKTTKYKECQFILYYDDQGQREWYSGVRVFPRLVNGKEMYSDPTIQNNGKTQASKLKSTYAKFKGKKPEEVSLKEFLSFLASKPKAKITGTEFEYEERTTKKNIVTDFL